MRARDPKLSEHAKGDPGRAANAATILPLVVFLSCSTAVDSQRDRVTLCSGPDDCPSAVCACGICSKTCAEAVHCDGLDGLWTCARAKSYQCVDLVAPAVCLPSCGEEEGCPDGLTCIRNACVVGSENHELQTLCEPMIDAGALSPGLYAVEGDSGCDVACIYSTITQESYCSERCGNPSSSDDDGSCGSGSTCLPLTDVSDPNFVDHVCVVTGQPSNAAMRSCDTLRRAAASYVWARLQPLAMGCSADSDCAAVSVPTCVGACGATIALPELTAGLARDIFAEVEISWCAALSMASCAAPEPCAPARPFCKDGICMQ